MKLILSTFFLLIGWQSFCQTAWNWTVLDTMPIPISNNAVAYGNVSGEDYVFSFGGIDTTKIYSGITQRSFKYHTQTGTWSEILPLPSSLPNIAAAASTVKNKIYIIGGYHVYSNGNEVSSNEVIIYNPNTDTYEPNGASIPTPIDDHVQCVWRDSLIYVITGWSNTTNVPKVQIYNPALNTWQSGTDTPNSVDYKVFGASGTIIGDIIYYFGGAKTGGSFPATNKLRKGIIDSNNPTNIIWTLEENAPNNAYRSACVSHGNNVFWIGGSATSYNYNGIAYNGSGGVMPNSQIMRYQTYYHDWYAGNGTPYQVMDLRGAAQMSPTTWIICGGMDENQEVTNRTFLLTYDPITGGIKSENKTNIFVANRQIYSDEIIEKAELFDLNGKLIEVVDTSALTIKTQVVGVYILQVKTSTNLTSIKVVLNK